MAKLAETATGAGLMLGLFVGQLHIQNFGKWVESSTRGPLSIVCRGPMSLCGTSGTCAGAAASTWGPNSPAWGGAWALIGNPAHSCLTYLGNGITLSQALMENGPAPAKRTGVKFHISHLAVLTLRTRDMQVPAARPCAESNSRQLGILPTLVVLLTLT